MRARFPHAADATLAAVEPADPTAVRAVRRAVLRWFDRRGRPLAFRGSTDPYAVLVSEVMLQQTQVARVEPAWRAFVSRFPALADLAAASPADVLRAWAGLGYNRRALDLGRAARAVVERHGGRLPGDVAALEALPGVGPYTARAVAAIAFGVPVAAVDTNVRRVVSRLVGPATAPPPRTIQRIADGLVDPRRPADWTHALMDLGAALCRPRVPRCGECPVRSLCASAGQLIGASPGPARARVRARVGVAEPYPATTRWLRGRIVERLRAAPDGTYLAFGEPLGDHPSARVAVALRRLAAEGLVELDGLGRARLPTSPAGAVSG